MKNENYELVNPKSILAFGANNEFSYNGIRIKSMQHWLIANKCIMFKQYELAEKVLLSSNPSRIAMTDAFMELFDIKAWRIEIEDLIRLGVENMIACNPSILEYLKSTTGKLVYYGSAEIGIGKISKKHIFDESKWIGMNIYGKVLTEFREMN